ncbi:glutamate--cysteine ligase [Halonotius roseus]|uniref:Glutamate--cysteine ligase n=2 Tax=Halonotius roseus TaxID=2511997 RepID=A0A544QSG8_9EURY|nr:glutamate-cysteine ligase family protein [Halonotius roseus]TQQ82395.1 glutamate--cysteine ligase [Halonotius roseus]
MTSNAPLKRSIEVEYWVVDDEGYLTQPGSLIDLPGAEREFVEPMLELKTTPCQSTAELREELFDRIRAAVERGDDLGKQLVPLATPLNHKEIREIPCDRTRIQNEVVGDDFQYVRHCAGTHIHIEQQPGRAVDQLNTLIALDPALALVNSARHFRGEAMAPGARSKCYRWLAYDDLQDQGELWPYVDDRADWTHRLQTCYDRFREQAIDTGIDEPTFESCFDPESAVWTPVQLREEFGTVEWRSPDTTLPSRTVALADTLARVAGELDGRPVDIGGDTPRVDDDRIVLPEFETVREYVDTAIQDGLTESLATYLSRMGFDPDAFDPIADSFEHEGPIDHETARQLRLEYATRLREDVRQSPAMTAD